MSQTLVQAAAVSRHPVLLRWQSLLECRWLSQRARSTGPLRCNMEVASSPIVLLSRADPQNAVAEVRERITSVAGQHDTPVDIYIDTEEAWAGPSIDTDMHKQRAQNIHRDTPDMRRVHTRAVHTLNHRSQPCGHTWHESRVIIFVLCAGLFPSKKKF